MDKVELSAQDIKDLLKWRDQHQDEVRSHPVPLKAVEIVMPHNGYHTHRDRTHGRKAPVERRVPKCTLFDEWLPGEYQKCEKCLEATRSGKERLP